MNDYSNGKPIKEVLETLNEKDRTTFLACRGLMRRSYLQCIASTIGMHNYTHEDDTFLDAIDVKIEMLMARAGIATNLYENEKPEEYINDPFALITRPEKVQAVEPVKPAASTEGNPNINVVDAIREKISTGPVSNANVAPNWGAATTQGTIK